MRITPGTLREGGAAFAPTHWSLVLLAAESQSPEAAREALARLYQDYWPPLYSFVRRRGHGPADAQDLVQGFFVHLLERKTLARADLNKGKFRSFLLGSLQHYLANDHEHEHALKRGGGQRPVTLDEECLAAEGAALAVGSSAATPGTGEEDRVFEQRWAATLVSHALTRLRTEPPTEDVQAALFDSLLPFVTGVPPVPDQAELAARFNLPPVTVRSHVHRLRQRFRQALRDEIARTVSTPAQIDEELRHLHRVLTNG